ncbi:MAG: DegT/DnrJ/EryC1/StrS family aminotransferase, partial [Candidatus Omnitrophota bacterium]
YKTIKGEIDSAINGVLESQSFIQGKELSKLEEGIASYCGVKYAVGVSSGTDALTLALKAAGIGTADEVITVPFTFIATGEAISNAGATPVFVDIDPRSYTMDPALIESKITKKTKAVIPVHLYGQCADTDGILKVAKGHNLKVIEDAAQAIGAEYKKKKAGSMGDVGCISFFPSKNLGAFGDGGMIVTDDKDIAEKIKLLRVHGSSKRYVHPILGYNSRLDNLQAAVLNVKLKYLDKWASARRKNAEYFDKVFKGMKNLTTPFTYPHNTHVYHQYAVKVDSAKRDKFIEFLINKGIESRVYYPIPLHMQGCYKFLGYKKGDFPNSEEAAETTLVLPVYPELKEEELKYIVDTVKEFCKKLIEARCI